MLFIKRYDLLKDDNGFKLQYQNEVIRLDATNWDEADLESRMIINKLKEENKEIVITFD